MSIERRRAHLGGLCAVILGALAGTGCYSARGSHGGGETEVPGGRNTAAPRPVDPSDVALPPGYRIEVVATGLNMPSAVTFDDTGRAYVLESGFSYGEVYDHPRLVEILPGGGRRVVATGDNPPWTGVAFHRGSFFVAEGGAKRGGGILKIERNGAVKRLISGLPSMGDHHTNGPAIGPDGMVYFTQGTVTNSGVVGPENYTFGWLARHPGLHDVPCKDIKVEGYNFRSANPLTADPNDEAKTGAFVPFGTPTTKHQIIKGRVPCSGAVMKISPDGGEPELVAWGLRNPFGVAFAPDGQLFVTDNSYDNRGSRPIFGSGDYLWKITQDTWYGWPDYAGGRPVAMDRYSPPGKPALTRLLAEIPNKPPRASAEFGVHASATGLDFSRNPAFGHVGEAFVAQWGDMAPNTGKVMDPVGYKVVRVDPKTGVVRDFAANEDEPGPASQQDGGGLERPVWAKFDPSGAALYVVDYGIVTMSGETAVRKNTGVLWRITRTGG